MASVPPFEDPFLVFDIVTNRVASIVSGSIALVFFALLWAAFPLTRRAANI